MMNLERLWLAVAEHAVLLLVLLPVLGALMTRMVGAQSPEGARSVARANSWLSLVLLVIVIAQFDRRFVTPSDQWQMRSAVTWVRLPSAKLDTETVAASEEAVDGDAEQGRAEVASGPSTTQRADRSDENEAIRIAVGIDGIGLMFATLIVAVSFVALRHVAVGRDEHRRLADFLFAESALLAVLTATDAVWLSVCLLFATGAMFVLIARVGEPLRRVAAIKFLRAQLLSTLMLIAGVLGLCVSCWWMSIRATSTQPLTFDLPIVVERLPRLLLGAQAAHDHWELMGSWLFLLLAGACVLRVPIPPFHAWLPAVGQQADRSVLALFLVGWLPTSFVFGLRLLGRPFEAELGQLGERVLIWCSVAAFGMACASIGVKEPRRRFVLLTLAPLTLCFGGLWVGSQSAVQGAGLLLAGACGLGALTLLVDVPESQAKLKRVLFALLGIMVLVPGCWCLLRNLLAYGGLWLWTFGAVGAACWSIASWPRCSECEGTPSRLSFVLPLMAVLGVIALAPQVVLDLTSLSPGAADEVQEEPE